MIDGLKPYPTYKDSGVPWLEKVPKHWDAAAVRRYCRVFAGATPSRAVPEYWRGGSIPWLASGDVNLRRITGARQFITEAGYAASSTKWIRPGSLVLALAGQGRTKGMVATVDFRTTCNQSLAAVDPSPRKSDYRFLAYYLESRYLDLRALVGDGLRDGLNLEHVRSIVTPVPLLPEQAAIVRFLDHADRRIRRYIRAKQKLIKLLEEQKQAIIHRAVTRGLDPNVRLKPSGVEWLGDVPEHWQVRKLRQCGSIAGGMTPSMEIRRFWDGAIPWVTPKDMKRAAIGDSSVRVTDAAIQETSLRLVDPPAILMVVRGMILARRVPIAWTTAPVTINQDMKALKPVQGVNAEFLARSLDSAQEAFVPLIDEAGHGTRRLPTERWRDLAVSMPPEDEQATLVRFLNEATQTIVAAIDRAHREISLLREYRTRLIAEVVTGKLDVREAAARLPDETEEPGALDEANALTDGEEEGVDDLGAVPEEAEA